jgi:hypothetical protein
MSFNRFDVFVYTNRSSTGASEESNTVTKERSFVVCLVSVRWECFSGRREPN